MFAGAASQEPLYDSDFVLDATSNTLTIAGSRVLTTATMTVHSGDPFRFNGGTELEGIGGTWLLPSSSKRLLFDSRFAASYSNQGFLGDCATATPTVPPIPDVPFVFYVLQDSSSYDCDDAGTTQTNEVGSYPDSCLDIVTSPSGSTMYRFTPNAGMYYGTGSTTSTYAHNVDIRGNLNADGALDIDSTANVDGIATFGQHITIGSQPTLGMVAGAVRASYGLFSNDLHAYAQFYASNGAVFGRGRQDHTQDGSIWIETQGTCNTPTCMAAPTTGSQETRIYTSQQGTHFVNKLHAFNEGSTNSAFMFDHDIMTSGSLETSSTVNIQGICEGVATVASGGTSVTVSTSAVTSSDTIPLSYPSGNNSGGAPWIESITSGTNFVINTTGAVTTDTIVNWKLLH